MVAAPSIPESVEQLDWILELALILLAAKVGAELFNRIRQSPMLGEILAGVILGPSILALLHESHVLELFAEIGIIFMIFMLGLETKVSGGSHATRPHRAATASSSARRSGDDSMDASRRAASA